MSTKIELFLFEINKQEAERLKNERIRLGFNQAEFSERLGIHKNTQINYENGKRKPSTEYYKAIYDLGIDVPYVITGKRLLDFPQKASSLASKIFKKHPHGFNPEAMAALFYMIGMNEINNETHNEDKLLSTNEIDILIRLAFERGEEFWEAYSAITLYFSEVLSVDDVNTTINLDQMANLIFETIELYDSVKGQFSLVSMHDNMRLVAQQILNSHSDIRGYTKPIIN